MFGSKKIKIVAHSSKFHTDDVFAVATLQILLKDKKFEVIRSRDMSVIEKGDYVVDVGGVYDPKINRFDHHQEGGAGKRENGVPYASFGLVWKEFGEKICGNREIANKIDKEIVQPVDAYDNGVQFLETKIPGLHDVNLNTLNFLFLPTWKEENTDIDQKFLELVSYAKVMLERVIKVYTDEAEAKQKVIDLYIQAEDKRLIILDERYPWEETLSQFPEPLFVVYIKRVDNNWNMKVVRNDPYTFTARKQLPESWAGKSGEELEKITGVNGAIFCHNKRFLVVAKTKEAILELAKLALEE